MAVSKLEDDWVSQKWTSGYRSVRVLGAKPQQEINDYLNRGSLSALPALATS